MMISSSSDIKEFGEYKNLIIYISTKNTWD